MPRPDPSKASDTKPMRVVTLAHGGHRWRFACTPGDEAALVAAAAEAAMRGGAGLDLADAAILARRLDAWPRSHGGTNTAAGPAD